MNILPRNSISINLKNSFEFVVQLLRFIFDFKANNLNCNYFCKTSLLTKKNMNSYIFRQQISRHEWKTTIFLGLNIYQNEDLFPLDDFFLINIKFRLTSYHETSNLF